MPHEHVRDSPKSPGSVRDARQHIQHLISSGSFACDKDPKFSRVRHPRSARDASAAREEIDLIDR
jgi:hypothetical protein